VSFSKIKEDSMMNVKFGNLTQPRHSEDPEKPEAKEKIDEMMQKLHDAGFKQVSTITNLDDEPMGYHIYDLPHSIEFSSDVEEAIKIMTPYSNYMKPLAVQG
jgi:hypothetical protein